MNPEQKPKMTNSQGTVGLSESKGKNGVLIRVWGPPMQISSREKSLIVKRPRQWRRLDRPGRCNPQLSLLDAVVSCQVGG